MIYEISRSIIQLKDAGCNQLLIFLLVSFILLIIGVLVENTINSVTKNVVAMLNFNNVVAMLNFNKEKKYYKLVERHLCWYRNRSRELFSSKNYDQAKEYMDKGISDLAEVMKNVFTESEKPVSRETGQNIDRSSTGSKQSHATITD